MMGKLNKENLLNKDNKFAVIIISVVIFLIVLIMLMGLISKGSITALMGNSVTKSFYYCEDASYNLKDDKCIKVETSESILLGDVDLNGSVTLEDLNLLNNYLAKTVSLQDLQLTASDVNSDGLISVGDVENIRLYLNGHNAGSEYLSKIGTTLVCPKDYTLKNELCIKETIKDASKASYSKGDVNLDGKIDDKDIELLNKYLNKDVTFTNIQLKVADFNENDNIDINDLNELKKYLDSESKVIEYLGDITKDGKVDANDVVLLDKYVNKQIELTKDKLKYADVNKDGVVDQNDVKALALKISSFYQVGDINLDGKIDIADLTVLQNGLNAAEEVNIVQQNLCDINADGKINNEDAVVLRSKVSNIKKYKKGDLNLDGKVLNDDVRILENYVLGKTNLTIDQLSLADINSDGTVNNTDANGLAKSIAQRYQSGDVNLDGVVDIVDIGLIKNHILGLEEFDTVQKLLADKNSDGKINVMDLK